MPLYRYKAATPAGEVLEGEREGASREAVVRSIQAEGNLPIRAEEVSAPSAGRARAAGGRGRDWSGLLSTGGRIRHEDVVSLTLELSTLLEAGMPVDRAMPPPVA